MPEDDEEETKDAKKSKSDLPDYPADPLAEDVPGHDDVKKQVTPHFVHANTHRTVTVGANYSLRHLAKYAYRGYKNEESLVNELARRNGVSDPDANLATGSVIQLPPLPSHLDQAKEDERLQEWDRVHVLRKRVGQHKRPDNPVPHDHKDA